MKTTLLILLCIVGFFFIAKTNISFSPFKISFSAPYTAIGYTFLILAIIFLQHQSYKNGKAEGLTITKAVVKQTITEYLHNPTTK